MGLIVQQKALEAAKGLQPVLPIIRKADKDLFDQVRRAMNSVVLNIAEAEGNDAGTARARCTRGVAAPYWRLNPAAPRTMSALPCKIPTPTATACGSAKEVRAGLQLAAAYGYVGRNRLANLDIALDQVCAMSWRLSGR